MAAQLTFFGTWETVASEPQAAEHVAVPLQPEPAPKLDPRQGFLFDGPHSIRCQAEQACEQLDAAALRRAWLAARASYPQWPGSRSWSAWADGIEQLVGAPSVQEQAARALSLGTAAASVVFPEMSATLLGRIRSAALSRAAGQLVATEGLAAALPDGRPAGYLHLAAGRPEQAALLLLEQKPARTSKGGRGLLLGYLGEALWRCGRREEALVAYRNAYLAEPTAVDEAELSCSPIMDLLDACADLALPGEHRGWLPVLADLEGSIPLLGSHMSDAAADTAAGRSAVLLAAYRRRQSEGMEDEERIRRKRELLHLAPWLKERLRRI